MWCDQAFEMIGGNEVMIQLRDDEEKRLRKEYNLEYLERAANEDNKDDDKS